MSAVDDLDRGRYTEAKDQFGNLAGGGMQNDAVTGAKQILAVRATQQHRTIDYTVPATDAEVPSKLTPKDYDVLLVHDQKSAPAGALATLGGAWAAALTTFTKGGGVVVVLDGDVGTAEMPAFATSGGLLQVGSHTPLVPGSPVTVTAPSDVVGVGVLSPYGVWSHSASFTVGNTTNVTYIVRAGNGTGDPVVAHRVVP